MTTKFSEIETTIANKFGLVIDCLSQLHGRRKDIQKNCLGNGSDHVSTQFPHNQKKSNYWVVGSVWETMPCTTNLQNQQCKLRFQRDWGLGFLFTLVNVRGRQYIVMKKANQFVLFKVGRVGSLFFGHTLGTLVFSLKTYRVGETNEISFEWFNLARNWIKHHVLDI